MRPNDMTLRGSLTALVLFVASCGGGGSGVSDREHVRLADAQACGSLVIVFVSADEQRAAAIVMSRDQAESLNRPTEVELTALDAELVAGRSLGRAYCTDLPGGSHVDGQEPFVSGTLSVAIEGGRADLTLKDAATETSELEDATFSDVFVAGAPG